MAGSLRPIRERLAGAHERFEELETACDRFVYDEPSDTAVGIGVETHGEPGEWTAHVIVPEPLPSNLTRLVGEILYHLRGSLDNLAWQLVIANSGTPGAHTEFPVFKDKGPFEKSAPGKMAGMSKAAQAAITDLQPFNTWPEHPEHATIWKVHDLNIIDKHRLPHLACLWLAWIKGDAVIGANGRVAFKRRRGCVENGAELLRLEWDREETHADTEMRVEFHASFDVAIHNPGQVEFMSDRKKPEGSVPVRHLFKVAFDYMESVVLPAFEAEFA